MKWVGATFNPITRCVFFLLRCRRDGAAAFYKAISQTDNAFALRLILTEHGCDNAQLTKEIPRRQGDTKLGAAGRNVSITDVKITLQMLREQKMMSLLASAKQRPTSNADDPASSLQKERQSVTARYILHNVYHTWNIIMALFDNFLPYIHKLPQFLSLFDIFKQTHPKFTRLLALSFDDDEKSVFPSLSLLPFSQPFVQTGFGKSRVNKNRQAKLPFMESD